METYRDSKLNEPKMKRRKSFKEFVKERENLLGRVVLILWFSLSLLMTCFFGPIGTIIVLALPVVLLTLIILFLFFCDVKDFIKDFFVWKNDFIEDYKEE